MKQVVLCHPVRTAIGTYSGALKGVPAAELGAAVLREVVRRAGLAPERIDAVVMGNVIQAGNRMNPARQAAIHAGLPVSVPAMTVNRMCGSGAQGIASAAAEIMAGLIDCAIGGGMENMDRAPYLVTEGRWGYRMGDAAMFDSMLMDGLNDAFSGKPPAGTPRTSSRRARSRARTRTAGRCARSSASPAPRPGAASRPRSSAWR